MLKTSIDLLPFDELYPFFKFDSCFRNGNRVVNREQFFKIYHDGSHYVGSVVREYKKPYPKLVGRKRLEIDELFDAYFLLGLRENLRRKDLFNFIKNKLQEHKCYIDDIDAYIFRRINVKFHNLHKRLKIFKRKARLNKWTHFVTLTYDDNKCDENEFKYKLKRCLANLHTRRGWKYMGVFERAPKTDRLHFHALMYVPSGEMVGTIEDRLDYSTAQQRMQLTHCNVFFEEKFGRNDFAKINDIDVKKGNAIDYITKYIAKSGERILYSRGIPSCVIVKLNYADIATTMFDFIQKFVLFDDVIDYERDVLKIGREYRQLSMFT